MSIVHRVVGVLSTSFGIIALAGAAVSLSATHAAWLRVKGEPEDFYGLLVLAGLGIILGAAAVITGWVLIRGRALGRLSPRAASALSATVALVLLALSAVGFISDRATAMEVRLLPVPAMIFIASSWLLARLRVNSPS